MRSRTLMGVWLDSSKAVIVRLQDGDSTMVTLESDIEGRERIEGEGKTFGRFGNQFVDHQKSRDNKHREMEGRFIERVVDEVRKADQLLIFGPAHMKLQLEKELKAQPAPVPNIRAVESADAMTDNQIAAYVRDFFGKSASLHSV